MSDCGHDHSNDPLQGIVCDATRYLYELSGNRASVAVVVMPTTPEGNFDPKASYISNVAGAAVMARSLLELVTRLPRPVECENCQAAYDEAVMALQILRSGKMGGC